MHTKIAFIDNRSFMHDYETIDVQLLKIRLKTDRFVAVIYCDLFNAFELPFFKTKCRYRFLYHSHRKELGHEPKRVMRQRATHIPTALVDAIMDSIRFAITVIYLLGCHVEANT